MSESKEHRFAPGDRLGDRYVIKEHLGKGGMGEVYRAADNQFLIGQQVALKIPLETRWKAGLEQSQLASEARFGLQISHPNVCRYYGLQKIDDVLALSMEFIKGLTLAKILKLPAVKLKDEEKLKIALELCAGLEAIHRRGIVHLDLKPSNIMITQTFAVEEDFKIERESRTVITDFGLADVAVAVCGRSWGTPRYKAPEQVSGENLSKASDVFALGTVLYELFTGEQAFKDESREEVPAHLDVDDPNDERLEFRVKQVIADCLEIDPKRRPTPREIRERLPPAPLPITVPILVDRLRYWPKFRPLRKLKAWTAIAAAAAGLAFGVSLGKDTQLTKAAVDGESPQVLKARAQQVLRALEYDDPPADILSGYTYEPAQLEHVAANLEGTERWSRLADSTTPGVVFWYRQSPERLIPRDLGNLFHAPDDPAALVPGMISVRLDPRGRLVQLDVVPESQGGASESRAAVDWVPLLLAAGLTPEALRPVEPAWVPPVFADQRMAWIFPASDLNAKVRVEAAAYRGRPVAFRFQEPWSHKGSVRPSSRGLVPPRFPGLFALWFVGVLTASTWLVWRNRRLQEIDFGGAFRVAFAALTVLGGVWLFGADHLPGLAGVNLFLSLWAQALMVAVCLWLIYCAMEPYVRRAWPALTATWIRLVYGQIRDPRVGRDLLAGGCFAVAWVVWMQLYAAVPGWLGLVAPRPDRLGSLVGLNGQSALDVHLEALRGLRQALAMEIFAVVYGVLATFFAVVLVVIIRKAFSERVWLGRAAALLVLTVHTIPDAGVPVLDAVAALGASVIWLTALIRFGFLAVTTMAALAALLYSHPLTFDLGAWHAPGSTVALVVTVGVMAWGTYHALAGKAVVASAEMDAGADWQRMPVTDEAD